MINPSQPLSIDVFDRNLRLNEIVLGASDVITFPNYDDKENLLKQIKELKQNNRLVVCTEWMNRPRKSIVATHLQIFHDEKVGCFLWGLVNGKTQTDLPWGHRPGDPTQAVWQHDLYRPDFTAYDPQEIKTIEQYRKGSE